jgi:hypothetical protein
VGIATIGQFSVWWGGHSFGPRLLADVMPAVVLGLVPVWPAIRRSALTRTLFALAFAVSVLAEVVGPFYFPSPRAVDWDTSPRDVDFAHERLWDWRDPQLLRLVRNGRRARASVPPLTPDPGRLAAASRAGSLTPARARHKIGPRLETPFRVPGRPSGRIARNHIEFRGLGRTGGMEERELRQWIQR